MQPFDSKTYTRLVLQPYAKGGLPDPFERYLLDLADNDDDVIDQRMEEVRRFWNNNQTLPPPVGTLITAMIKDHNTLLGQLGDGTRRRGLAAEVESDRERRTAVRMRGVDTALRGLHKAHGGIPDEERPRLVALGKLSGLTEAETNAYV